MKQLWVVILFVAIPITSYTQSAQSFTQQLVWDFHKAWNEEDLDKMESLLDKNAFFKSPFQLRYSRDTMLGTVLRTNPKVFKVSEITETHSEIRENMAWSIGKMVSDHYDKNGNKSEKQWHNDYVYIFVRNEKGEWKLQMLLYHE